MKSYYIIVVSCLVVSCLSILSCSSTKHIITKNDISKKDLPKISENKLLRNIETNELEYNTLFAKRISATLSSGKGSDNFKASLRIQRDSFIQISVTGPLNIELARVLLTTDSVKFINMYEKKYFVGNYDYFYDKFDMHLDYSYLQSILTNTFFNLDISKKNKDVKDKNKKTYKLNRTDIAYELSTIEEKSLNRKIKKMHKKLRKNKDFILILQKILIDPQSFRPLSMLVKDIEEETGVNITYGDFKYFSRIFFPERISFDLFSDNKKMSLILKFDKLEFDIPVKSNLRISSKYKRIE